MPDSDATPLLSIEDATAALSVARHQLKEARERLSYGECVEAVSLLQDAAPVLPEASFVLADCYRHGIGVEKAESQRAWFILQRLIAQDYVPAIVLAAYWVRDYYYMTNIRDSSIPKDDKRSFQLLQRALQLQPDNSDALTAYGVALLNGRGCSTSVLGGLQALQAAVELGDVQAYSHLGSYYLNSIRTLLKPRASNSPENQEYARQGLKFLYMAAKAGDAFAHASLADVYRDEKHFPPSLLNGRPNKMYRERKADEYDLRAAELGLPQGYVNIGEGYATGSGSGGFDFDQAAFYFHRAYHSGIAAAADALGYHYEKGSDKQLADKVKLTAAVAWYERGYELEHAAATLHLGECFDDGIGVKPDPDRAEQFYRDAIAWAKRDDAPGSLSNSRSNLAKLYVGKSFLDVSPSEAKQKLVELVGPKEAEAMTKEVSNILTCLGQNKKSPSRRAKGQNSVPTDSGTLEMRLNDLVGAIVGEKLVGAFGQG